MSKNSAYQDGFEQGQKDAVNYVKKDANRGIPFWKKMGFGISRYTQDYIVGYNKGYYAILRARKAEQEAKKLEEFLIANGLGDEKTEEKPAVKQKTENPKTLSEAEMKKALLKKIREAKELEKMLKSKDLEL